MPRRYAQKRAQYMRYACRAQHMPPFCSYFVDTPLFDIIMRHARRDAEATTPPPPLRRQQRLRPPCR